MTQEEHDNLKKAVGVFALIMLILFGTLTFMMLKTGITEKEKSVKLEQPKPQPKDTTTYHFSDEFTDAQLREMVRSGTIKIK